MIIITSYKLNYNSADGIYTIITKETSWCPLCDGTLIYRDRKGRKLKNNHGETKRFKLRRFNCEECGKLHTEIPDIIQPYKHYNSATIQNVIDSAEDYDECVACDSTIRRWKTSFAESEQEISQRLSSVEAKGTDKPIPISQSISILKRIRNSCERWLAFVMTLLINSGHKLRTRFTFVPLPLPDKIEIAAQT